VNAIAVALTITLNHFYSQHTEWWKYPDLRFPDLRVPSDEAASNFINAEGKDVPMCAWVTADNAIYIKAKCLTQSQANINYYIAHELCHLVLDDKVLIAWGRLPKSERDARHARVEKCAIQMLTDHRNCR
jgi:hypothetical protein